MGLFDSMFNGIFGDTGIFQTGYNATEGLPAYQPGTNQGAVNQSQTQAQAQIAQQQAFLNALGSNGLNANQAGVYGQQQGLANQYQMMANGQGPNPAQAQLAQNTGQNIQQQAALMGSMRGGQANPGLMARQASQQGGAIQQQSAGQAATLGAQQQIAGMQGMQNQYGQMANLATAGVGQQQNALAQLGNQSQNYQQLLQQQLQAQNQNQMQGRLANADIAKQGMQNTAGAIGGGMNALGSMMSGPSSMPGGGGGKAHGGVITQHFDDGGVALGPVAGVQAGMTASQQLESPMQVQQQSQANQPKSMLGQQQQAQAQPTMPMSGGDAGANAIAQGVGGLFKGVSGYGAVNNMMGQAQSGMDSIMKMAPMLAALSQGGPVPGSPKIQGDSEANDTVPAMLSPGEIVIPRSHVDSPEKIASFLNGLLGTNFKNGSSQKAPK